MNNYRITTPKKILILGSGGQKIGQSGEFDYAGLQAIRAFKSESIKTVLVNPNMTAVQTSEGIADATYFLPITSEFIANVIEKEKPDSILVNFGGKTALRCAIELKGNGVFEKYNMQVLGTSLEAARKAADRGDFMSLMRERGIPVPDAAAATSVAEAKRAAERIGYPVMVRGDGSRDDAVSGVCADQNELGQICERIFSEPGSALVEQWLGGWKEIEFEIVRDAMDNFIVACSMENIDPLGVHAGESIVVAPCQTLTGDELRKLREISLSVARTLDIIGNANVRFALDPESDAFRLIEVTPSISRSTALASKATGFPLGHIAARIALGFSLSEIDNKLSGNSRYCAEPAFDYLAVKVPRWDLGKFSNVDRHIGAEMKSVGEAMAFGKTFEEALQKAVRMIDSGAPGIACHPYTFKDVKDTLRNPTDLRIFAVYSALADGWTADRIHKHAKIDRWFINCIASILETERDLREAGALPPKELLLRAKRQGFSDAQIAKCIKSREEKVRALRKEFALKPVVKQIDTVSAETATRSNFLYVTWSGVTDDVKPSDRGVLVLGSGPYHIGSGIEYDWCCVSALSTIRKLGQYSIMLNCNPETVSTDFGAADRLYFEELSLERVLDIWEAERPDGVMVSMGGQTSNNLAIPLSRLQVPVYGTSPQDIDRAEDRNKFSAILDQLDIQQPEWTAVTSIDAAREFATKTGYPVLIRPSYVTSGAAMSVAWDDVSLKSFLTRATEVTPEHPVILTRYVENSKEIEIDAVANKGEILVYAISEHIENAGVHSGDATVVLPAQRIYLSTAQAIKKASRKIAEALEITGPFNIKFLAKSANIQVIECNLRASRSMPFCSKVFRIDMIDLAVRSQLGAEAKKVDGSRLDFDYVGVRAAQFSYSRLRGADPVAGVEMASTGEVGCIGRGVRDAFMKAMLSTGYRVPKGKILLSTGPLEDKVDFIDSARKLRAMGYELVASGGTARFLQNNDIPATALAWPLEDKKPNIADALRDHEVDLIINIPKNNRETELKNDYSIRSMAIDYNIPIITNIKVAKQFTDALEWYKTRGLEVKSREEYK
jgi:carbamoyl-phosphate synthase large subunit